MFELQSYFPFPQRFRIRKKNDFEEKNFEIKFMTLCYYTFSIDYGICKTKSAIQ